MPARATATVFENLSRSKARLEGARDLGEGVGLAIWSNARDRVRYENTRQHVLSLYLENGQESRRLDRGRVAGQPGALCIMPQGAHSDWEIGSDFRFLHLYLPDETLRAFAAETLDRAPASVTLPELTFTEDAALAGHMRALAQASGAPLAARAALNEVLHHLLCAPGMGGAPPPPLRGGLARATQRRVIAHMRANLDQPLRLADLAKLAGLSEFHFQRMFRVSLGVSPQRYLDRLRVARAEALIAAHEPLAAVAAACGFAHHSHLTRVFRAHRGVTPSAWRAAL